MQDVDCCSWTMFAHKLVSTTGGDVPLSLGFATYSTLADSFSGLIGRARRYGIRHVRRVT
jgi:hypothetical protein